MPFLKRLDEAGALSCAPDLQDICSVDEIMTRAASLAAGPCAPLVADALVREFNSDRQSESCKEALRIFASGLGAQKSYLALLESADFLLSGNTLEVVGPTLHDTLLPDQDIIVSQPQVAGLRLNIVLNVVVTTDHPPYHVLGILTQPVDALPEKFDDLLARAIGTAVDVWTAEAEQCRFAATLDVLTARGSEDAAYQRALQQLRQALQQQDQQELLEQIRRAHTRFVAVVSESEDRSDAQAFASACRAITAFHEKDQQALRDAAYTARKTAHRRALLLRKMHRRNEFLAGHAAELAWISLVWHLESTLQDLSEDSFLDTWAAAKAIAKVYEADRHFSDLRAVRAVIQPQIVNEIAARHTMARQLQRAVDADQKRDQPILPNEIYELVALTQQAQSTPNDSNGDSPEDSQGEPYLHALLGSNAALIRRLPDDDRASLEESARQSFVGTFAGDRPTSDLVAKITASLVSDLSDNPAFAGTVKSNFSLLVLNTVRFLMYVGDTRQPYTAPITADHPAPLESTVQKHFAQYLSATELSGRVGLEHANIATGRADVITTFDSAQRYVTEVKRERNNADRDSIESAYLTQAVEYQSTNQPFAQLLVLDLTDHTGGTPHLTDSIWVKHRRDDSQKITTSTLIAIVRGNRPTPSSMT